jgi:uncharacterized protein (DUF433 family)
MWTPLEPWQVAGLQDLANTDPERVESALNAVWGARPDLLESVTIAAVDRDEIGARRGSQILGISVSEVRKRLAAYRRRNLRSLCIVCEGSEAKLADSGIPVWEVVRVYRKLGSLARLQRAFAGTSRNTLETALAYARANPREIEGRISRYEEMLEAKSVQS